MITLCRQQRLNVQAYVCWQCHATSLIHGSYRKPRRQTDKISPKVSRRPFTIRYTIGNPNGRPTAPEFPVDSLTAPRPAVNPVFRQKLRQWEVDNSEKLAAVEWTSVESQMSRTTVNAYDTASGGPFDLAPVQVERGSSSGGIHVDQEGISEVGDDRTFLVAGDMVAIKSITGGYEMAIYIRDLETQSQFYSMSGRYIHTRSKASDFMIPGYFQQQELDEILPLLPTSDLPRALEDKLQLMGEHVPRHIGRPLIKKMVTFWSEAKDIYQKNAAQLDSAYNTLASSQDRDYTYGTLNDFALKILSGHVPTNADGLLPAPALFAVHQALVKEDSGIRVQSGGALRSAILYEVSSLRDQNLLRTVAREVQMYRKDIQHATSTSSLSSAIKQFQKLIDMSRKTRVNTKHGMIGPSTNVDHDQAFRPGIVVDELRWKTWSFLRFIEAWAGKGIISRSSPLNGIAATILKAVERYPGEILDQRTGWKFLQEVGFLPPWQTPQEHDLRLPVQSTDLIGFEPTSIRTPDLSRIHEELKTRVYCIDDVTAKEIDDGVSVRKTERSNEFWVGIHIADPASYIHHKKALANYAEARVGNTYFPDRITSMLPVALVEKYLTLAKDRPCLTFNALMNTEGEILDSNVCANTISEISYLTPATFADIGEEPSQILHHTYVVGAQQDVNSTLNRRVSGVDDLSPECKEDLKILHQLSRARDAKMQKQGVPHFNQPQPNVSASFGGQEWSAKTDLPRARQYHGDPSIRVTVPVETDPQKFNQLERPSAVARLMLTANEIAAKWCYERNIPIPYRKTDASPDKDPKAYYEEHIRPMIEAGCKVSDLALMKYYRQIGQARLSTSPGKHAALGVDLIAKVTSPLRRYPDLLAHWQIRAALVKEKLMGRSLAGKDSPSLSYLPFTSAQIEKKIPFIDVRERAIARAHRQVTRAWLCQFLVRAWKCGQAELPKRMKWRCAGLRTSKDEEGRTTVAGTLTNFACLSDMVLQGGIQETDVALGDEYEVELDDVDVYNLNISVKPIRKWVEEGPGI